MIRSPQSRRRSSGQRGYTLVEMVITLSVTSLVIIMVMNLGTNSLINYTVAETRSDILGQTQTALDIINNDIRLSASADESNRWEDSYAPGAPGDLYSWHSDADTVVLASAAEDSNGDILFVDPALYVSHKNNSIYFLADSKLYKRVLAAPVTDNSAQTTCPAADVSEICPADKVLLNDVESMTIRYFDGTNNEVLPVSARSVEIEVKVSVRKFSRDISVSYVTRTVFRND